MASLPHDEYLVISCPPAIQDIFYRFCLEEKWNPGLDARHFIDFIDNDEVLVVVRKPGGSPSEWSPSFENVVATILCPKYGPDFAWLGGFICSPDYRKQGHGAAVWRAAESYLKNVPNVGLDAVLAQVPRYEKAGFRVNNTSVRHCVKLEALHAATRGSHSSAPVYGPLHLLSTDDRQAIVDSCVAFEQAHFAPLLDRRRLLTSWLFCNEHRSFIVRDDNDSSLLGFATARPSADGFRIGPLYALDDSTATTLLAAITEQLLDADHVAESTDVFLDVSSLNAPVFNLLSCVGFKEIFALPRMYRGASPISSDSRVEYALFNWELTF